MAGIYIHIPFCKQACFYCDFHFIASLRHKDEVTEAILKEIKLRASELEEPVETIYFGGGTPSILQIDEIRTITAAVYRNFDVVVAPEITLEANPDDLHLEKIRELAASPVNRLSVGVQSFFDDDLRFMNRVHSAKEAQETLTALRPYFDNITVDLIYGVPGLTDAKWEANIRKLIALEIPHISAYALTVEQRTALAHFIRKGKYPPLNEAQAERQFRLLNNILSNNEYVAYEISNFAKPGWFSKHNTAYWQGKPYLGIGPSAHSFIDGVRSWNVANNAKYVKAIMQDVLPLEKEKLTHDEQFNEMVMTGLRTIWGVSLVAVKHKFGSEYAEVLLKSARRFIDEGLLENKNQHLILTGKGKFLADGIASAFFRVT